jgi:hypothetical protein
LNSPIIPKNKNWSVWDMAKHQARKKGFLVNFKDRDKCKGTRNNPTHFIFFDTETNQEDTYKKIGKKQYHTIVNTLKIGWACYYNMEENYEEWCYFETIKEFHDFISHVITITEKKALWIIAHNIVFDNFISDIWTFFKEKNFQDDFLHSKGMVYLQKMTRKTVRKNGKPVTQKVVMLVNNGNIFPEKLENIGETIGFNKLHIDFENSSLADLQIYCFRDVVILVEFWKQWAHFIKENKLGNLKYTISSQSMESFKKQFCDEYVVLDDSLENLAFERKGYYGGRTEIFFKGDVHTPIQYYDVNSMYPHVMKSFDYPIEYKFTKVNPDIEQVEYYINNGWLVMAECYMDSKNNAYPSRAENTLMFPKGKFITYLPTPEVRLAIENGDVKKFGKVNLYRGANLFKSYIEFFYNKRVELKKAHNKQEKMYKLFLNSLYGKFGQMKDSWKKTTVEEIQALIPDFDFDKWMMDEYKIPKIIFDGIDLTPHIRFIGGELQLSGEKEESEISFPAIASHVTSYARLIIWNVIKYCQQHGIKYYYCDTDSIFVDKELPTEFVDESELGKMKVEKYYEYGVEFINLKNYCGLNKNGKKEVMDEEKNVIQLDGETFLNSSKVLKGKAWKMKGVSVNAELIDENSFIQQEWGGLPKQEYYTRFGRKPGEFWVITKKKTNHGQIKKGNLQESGFIEPFQMNEWTEE